MYERFFKIPLVMNFKKNKNSIQNAFLNGWHPYAWITLTAFLVYFRSLFFEFTYLDDVRLINQNSDFLTNMANIANVFTTNPFAFHGNPANCYPLYRPMLFVSFMIDAQIGGVSPFVYHLTNIILHAVTSILVLQILIDLKYPGFPSFFMTLIFAVHPALSHAVIWVPGRCEVLLAIFGLSSLILYARYLKSGSGKYYVGHLVFLAFGFFTKESALSIILMCIFFALIWNDPWPHDKRPDYQEQKKRTLSVRSKLLWIEWGTITFVWFFMRTLALGDDALANCSVKANMRVFVAAFPGIIQLYGKTLFPFNLSVLPLQQDTSCIYAFLALIFTVLAVLLSRKSRKQVMAWGALWFVCFLTPAFLRPVTPDSVDLNLVEYRLYLPMVGLIIAWMETDFIKFMTNRWKVGLPIWALIFVLFLAITVSHSRVFRNPITFWESAVAGAPHSPVAHKNLGAIYYMDGLLNKSEGEYKKALALRPTAISVHNNLGLIHMSKGLFQEAEAEFVKEIELHPMDWRPYHNLGLLYEKQGRAGEAQYWWKQALDRNPNIRNLKNSKTFED